MLAPVQEIKLQIKKRMLSNPYVNRVNSVIKARLQERQARNELLYYQRKASERGIKLPDNETISQALEERLERRGIVMMPKRKGHLHIFLAYPLNNWEAVLPIALKPFGRVSEFEWRSKGFDNKSANWMEQRYSMNEAMLDAFLKANSQKAIDIVIGYVSGHNTDPGILQKMGKTGAVIINLNWDDKLWFCGKRHGGRWSGPAALTQVVDLNLTNAPESCIKYVAKGGLAMFWPEAAHPAIHKRYDLPVEYDVTFVGGKYGWRPRFIKRLLKMGINVTCFGNGWENGPLSDEEMVKVYSRSRIILGFAGVGHSKKIMCIKGRDFEVPMSGGLYLTQDNPELSLVYEVGKEIVTYKDEKDCADKIKLLLANPVKAEAIKRAGRKRAEKDHTWEKRFREIFRTIGLLS